MAKIGRNDPCPCGSGMRFKQCCLRTRRLRPAEQPATAAPRQPTASQTKSGAEPSQPRPDASAVAAKVLTIKKQYFERWKDEPLKSLGGLTPRQAAAHGRAWRKLEVVLKVKEHAERDEPPKQRYDFDQLRQELGLPKK